MVDSQHAELFAQELTPSESPRYREEQMTPSVRDNKAQSRFELEVEGDVAFANYRLAPDTVIINHTETPRALRGRGIASALVKGALELIRADGLKVVAGCSFVVDYLRKHPEFSDLMT
jgi:predicted GNAT family acetyltransferase